MPIREILLGLPFVTTRRLNGRDGFFTAGRMFALLGDSSILLRLPGAATEALVETDRALPLVGPQIPSPHAWVEVGLPAADPEELHRVLLTAHQTVRAASRRARRHRSAVRRRRTRATA